MKLLKTIRFDPSDTRVFDHAANQDEWAIPGGFWFAELKTADLQGKLKQSFSNGFLSLESFGFSTFTSVAEISHDEVKSITQHLADKFISDFGAPTKEAALVASRQEVEYVLEMCADVPINSIFALKRLYDDSGELKESFSLVEPPRDAVHTRVWDIVE